MRHDGFGNPNSDIPKAHVQYNNNTMKKARQNLDSDVINRICLSIYLHDLHVHLSATSIQNIIELVP